MQLDEFLIAAKAKGASDDFLVAMLREKGFPEGEVYGALCRYYEQATGIAVPVPRGRLESAREAFFQLLAFAALATWLYALGYLWFELIDGWYPDSALGNIYDWTWSRLAWQMASLIVAFPAFLWASWRVLRDRNAHADQAPSSLTRWIVNIGLLLTLLVCMGDLVTFVATFLEGGVTTRFALKSVVVMVLAGADFLYYNRGLSVDSPAPLRWHRAFGVAALAAIFVTLGLGFLRTGSPETQRMLAEDRRRVRDIYDITVYLSNRRVNGALEAPESLADRRTDPVSLMPYEYRRLSAGTYEICAVFAQPSAAPPPGVIDPWSHPSGRHCYQNKVEETFPYPVGR